MAEIDEDGPMEVGRVPFAEPTDAARYWPVQTTDGMGRTVSFRDGEGKHYGEASRAFLAARQGGNRFHLGVDLWARAGDVVLAPEDGIFVNTYHFYGGSNAFIFQTKSGIVLNLAEIRPASWEEFGVKLYDELKAGHPLARVARLRSGASMVHFETYRRGTRQNLRWRPGEQRPNALLNPTKYLIHLAQADTSPLADPVLERSDYGPAVSDVQTMLAALGYPIGRVDGDFGPRTEAAVIAFQRATGLTTDGVVESYTWAALRQAVPDAA